MVSVAQITTAPVLVPPAVSLIAAAQKPVDDTQGEWVRGFRYSPEADQQAWIDDVCVTGNADVPPVVMGAVTAFASVGVVTATPGAAGTLNNATYSYKVTSLNAAGQETAPNAAATATTSAGAGAGSVGLAWSAVTGAASYNVYGRISGSWGLLANVVSPAYTDTGAAAVGATAAASGTLGAATYGYRVSVVNVNGESVPSTEVTIVVPGSGSVILNWPKAVEVPVVQGGLTYRVYGRTPAGELRMVASQTTVTFTDLGTITPSGAMPTTNTTGGSGWYNNPPIAEWTPYPVRVRDVCSLMSNRARDYVGRVGRLLDAALPKAVEREFWTGTLARKNGYPNLYLQNASTVVDKTPVPGTPVSVALAFDILEQALGDAGLGAQGMIHCIRRAIPALYPSSPGIQKVGNVLKTAFDTIVVPGVGYTGNGPIGNAQEVPNVTPAATWIYATGLVEFRQSDPDLFPDWPQGSNGNIPYQAIDRGLNTVVLRGERIAVASWDGQVHFACLATLPT